MTTREELRGAATFLERLATIPKLDEGLPEFLRHKAAALRAIADRFDHEDRWAKDIEAISQRDPHIKHAAIIVQGVLARLDAPLPNQPPDEDLG